MNSERILGWSDSAATALGLYVAADSGSYWLGLGVWAGVFLGLVLLAALVLAVREACR